MTYTPTTNEPPLDQPYYGAPLGAALNRFLKKAFVYTGRASPSEYWWPLLAVYGGFVAGLIVLGILGVAMAGMRSNLTGGVIGLLYLLLNLALLAGAVVQISVAVRRLHDTGRPGTHLLFGLIPFAGPIIVLVLLLGRPAPEGARFDAAAQGFGGGYPAPGHAPHPAPVASPAPWVNVPAQGYRAPDGIPPVPMPGGIVPAVPPVPSASPRSPVPPVPGIPPVPGVPPVPAAPSAAVGQVPAVPAVPVPPASAPAAPIQSIPGSASAPIASAPVAGPMPVAPASVPEDGNDLDATRIGAGRVQAEWTLLLPDGRQLVVPSALRLGRDPVADAAMPGALLVKLDDPAKSISKTHAQLVTSPGSLTVTDLHSTNGTTVTTSDGVQLMLASDVPYSITSDADLQLGDLVLRVIRSGAR